MDIQHLRYFAQVCESGSILKASEKLFVTQQALSKSIAALERELGTPLFFRTAKGMTPTQIGQELLHHSQSVIREMDSLLSNMQNIVRQSSGRLRVDVSGGFLYLGSQKLWDGFKEIYPNIEIDTYEYGYQKSLSLLKEGQIDAAILSDLDGAPIDTGAFLTFSLPSPERLLIVERQNPLAARECLEITDLRNERFVLCINDFACEKFVRLCREHGFEPEIKRTSDTIYMCELCNHDGRSGLIIETVAKDLLPKFENLRLVPFKGQVLSYTLTLLVRKNYPRITMIQDLADYLSYSILGSS